MVSLLIPETLKINIGFYYFWKKLKKKVVLKPVLVRWLKTFIQVLLYE